MTKTKEQLLKEKEVREEIGKGYKKWAKSHRCSWETDNLVHDLMGNPEKPIDLTEGEERAYCQWCGTNEDKDHSRCEAEVTKKGFTEGKEDGK